jgi:hypothetical protein
MASNLTKRLDRLERLIRERTQLDTSPLYLREGQTVAEGVDPERVIYIKREYIDPPDRGEEELPQVAAAELSPASEPPGFGRPIHRPELGIV